MRANDPLLITPYGQSQASRNSLHNLQPSQLYAHPVVKNIVDSHQVAHNACLRLNKENEELRQEIRELRSELQENIGRLSFARNPYSLPEQHPGTIRAPSLSPSDSISQAGRSRSPSINYAARPSVLPILVNQRADRPPQYPPSILWHLHDCQEEPGIVTRVNRSRPNMERCIRYPDGGPIARYKWRDIMRSAKRIIQEVLRPLDPPDSPVNTRTFYRNTYPDVWKRAIACLEALEPLVGLCGFHWKAEHVIGQVLISTRSLEVRVSRRNQSQMASWTGAAGQSNFNKLNTSGLRIGAAT